MIMFEGAFVIIGDKNKVQLKDIIHCIINTVT